MLSRAREKGLEATSCARSASARGCRSSSRPGSSSSSTSTILDDQGAIDYADLIRRATIEATAHRDELRRQFRHVFVDEYQDTDPGQVALLRALAGDGRDLSSSATRTSRSTASAAPRCAASSTSRPTSRAPTARRPTGRGAAHHPPLRAAAPGRGPAGRRPDRAARARSRRARARRSCAPAAADGHGEGRVVVRTFDTDRAEAEHLADLLRRAHLEDGIAWDEMAVLVRSGRRRIPPLRRALGAAGVPVEVASDEVPLVRDPAVLPLIDALRAVVNLDNDDDDHVDYVDPARAEALLLGPLGGLDAGDVRRLAAAAARPREGARPRPRSRLPRTSRELVRARRARDGLPRRARRPRGGRRRAPCPR